MFSLALTIALGLLGMGIDPPGQPKTHVQLVDSPMILAEAGKATTFEFKFRVSNGLHINSNAPRSSYLIPTKLELAVPPELGTVKINYPEGKDFVFAFAPGEKLNVYSGEFSITTALALAKTAKPGNETIKGELTYQACNDRACFPPKKLPVRFNVAVIRVKTEPPTKGTTTH